MIGYLSPTGIEVALRTGLWRSIPTEVLHDNVTQLSEESIRYLVDACDSLLAVQEYGLDENKCISAIKMLTAMMPTSGNVIRRWMRPVDEPYMYEVQFKFCCFLDDILSFESPFSESARFIMDVVVHYLNVVPSDEGYGAFMAADMLADHWMGSESILALIDIAQNSQNPVGKKAARSALETSLRHGKVEYELIPIARKLTKRK